MKKTLMVSVVALALAGGCGGKKASTSTANNKLTELPPPPPQQVQPVAAAPVSSTPVDFGPATAADAKAGNPAPGTKYVVKKGDTLWSLAQKTYGDGKQYKKIVAANPSAIKNEKLLAGTTISLPQ